jgi:hypothetical protein
MTARPIQCRLLYQAASPHLQQLYTGFLMLHKRGLIRLSQERRKTPTEYAGLGSHLREGSHAHLDAVVDGRVRIHFDTHDIREVATGELDHCDFYFKRSFSTAVNAELPPNQRDKIRPLGLNYLVLPSTVDPFAVRRAFRLRGAARTRVQSVLKQAVDVHNVLGFEPRVDAMESPPDFTLPPRVLFLVAAYDPHDDPERSADKIEERININETRARCIALLKEALGDRFTGGFTSSPLTRTQYSDLVAPESTTSKPDYIATLRSHPICVATTGLHGSIGWKLGEYVAFSKAIVSEKLVYGVPGDFAPESHYVEFTSPEGCVEAAVRLVEDRDLRERLMSNNAAYYREYVRPDALIHNALAVALGTTHGDPAALARWPEH